MALGIKSVQSGWVGKMSVLSVYQYGLSGLVTACLFGVYVCCGSFLSFQRKNHPDSKSSCDLDPDKPVCSTSCQGDETDPTFVCTILWICVPDSRFLQPTLESWSQL